MGFKRDVIIKNKLTVRNPCLVRILGIVLLTVLILAINKTSSEASWLIFHKPAFKGKILDAETKQPIVGAVIVAVYKKWSWWFAPGVVDVIIKVRETLTDKQGIFSIPPYTTIIDPLSQSRFVDFIIYKPGYGHFMPHVTPGDQEIFFSEGFGEKREIELWSGTDREMNGPKLRRFTIPFGIVELSPVKTWEERMNAIPGGISDYPESNYPILKRFSDEEWNWVQQNRR